MVMETAGSGKPGAKILTFSSMGESKLKLIKMEVELNKKFAAHEPSDNHYVMDTLVGSIDKQCIEVTNSFGIPHKEYEERVEADIMYAKDMNKLNKKVALHIMKKEMSMEEVLQVLVDNR